MTPGSTLLRSRRALATVSGTNVAFSVAVRSVEAPAAVSVFYGPDESHLTELSLGTANASVNLRLGSQDLVLVDTMQEDVTYLCVARMDIDADGANETATGFAVPVDDYVAPAWSETVLRANVVGADTPLAWFGIVGGYKTNKKYFSFDELAVSTILSDVVPVPSADKPPVPTFRAPAEGGALVLDGSTFSMNLAGADTAAYYAAFTNGTLNGTFFAAADGVHPAADGSLRLSVPAPDDAKFVAVGASYEEIHEGDSLRP